MMRSRIAGTGRALPEKRLTNADLERMVETSDAWIVERTGIRERRILAANETTADLGALAGLRACQAAGVDPANVDCIVVGTVTPDHPFPATAAYIQKKLGAKPGGAAFDLSAACAGFLYGLSVGDGLMARGQFRCVLVIGVEALSRMVDWNDRSTCVLFGDGAGAVLLVAEENAGAGPGAKLRGVLSTHIYCDGGLADLLYIPSAEAHEPSTSDVPKGQRQFVKMNGREVYKHAVRNMAAASKTALETNGLVAGDVDWVIAHQANLRIIEGVSERVQIPMSRFFVNIEKYGNTSSASLPIALDEAVEQGKIKEGQVLLFTALGGGLAWGAAALRW
jgi:3-oxoacyl-[acyl-carrier-protein] synthase-3